MTTDSIDTRRRWDNAVPIPDRLPIEVVDELDDDDLREFIGSRLGHNEPKQLWDALLHPDLIDRTKEALTQIHENLLAQIRDRRESIRTLQLESRAQGETALPDFVNEKADYDDWLRRAGGYRRLIERRIREMRAAEKRVKQESHDGHQLRQRDEFRNVAAKLAVAVHQHRASMRDADIKPEAHDVALWSLLAELTIERSDKVITLDEAIDYGYWTAS